ncbi:MAG: exodeoxyribonuclease VII small subunit [Coriobacteriia bacterium]|nr:exodeoxyribonuclease VII small subunit [Coriobacteriia bacterium]
MMKKTDPEYDAESNDVDTSEQSATQELGDGATSGQEAAAGSTAEAALDGDPQSYSDAKARLDEIVKQVRAKDVSLEHSLDLLEEGVKLANQCTEMIDQTRWEEETEEDEEAEAGEEAVAEAGTEAGAGEETDGE